MISKLENMLFEVGEIPLVLSSFRQLKPLIKLLFPTIYTLGSVLYELASLSYKNNELLLFKHPLPIPQLTPVFSASVSSGEYDGFLRLELFLQVLLQFSRAFSSCFGWEMIKWVLVKFWSVIDATNFGRVPITSSWTKELRDLFFLPKIFTVNILFYFVGAQRLCLVLFSPLCWYRFLTWACSYSFIASHFVLVWTDQRAWQTHAIFQKLAIVKWNRSFKWARYSRYLCQILMLSSYTLICPKQTCRNLLCKSTHLYENIFDISCSNLHCLFVWC